MSTTTFTYKSTEQSYLGERYPGKTLIIKTDCTDLDAHELLDLFKSFMVGCGYAEKSFYDACIQAAEQNVYSKGRNRSKLVETNKTEEGYQDPYKYPTGM